MQETMLWLTGPVSNDMRPNASKSEELLISFTKSPLSVDEIIVDGTSVYRVEHCTLLGLQIAHNLLWDLQCHKILKKANTRLFFLKQPKRAKVSAYQTWLILSW